MPLTEAEQHQTQDLLATAATEILSNAMGVKVQQVQPSRLVPLALAISRSDRGDTLSVVPILDIAQHIATLRAAVRQLEAHAFVILFDGFVQTPQGRQDALLLVSGTEWGVWHASASPYKHQGMGAYFNPTIQVPEAATGYHEVFGNGNDRGETS